MTLNAKALEAARAKAESLLGDLGGALRESYIEVAVAHTTAYLSSLPQAGVSEEMVARLSDCVARLDALETLPKPYDLYYAVKNDGENSGWRYLCASIGVEDLRALEAALSSLQEEAVPVACDEDSMPERIWAGDFTAGGFGHCVMGPQGGLYAEYVRADLAVPADAGEPTEALEWHRDDSGSDILFYTLRERGRRRGVPVMVNDVTVRIAAGSGSMTSIGPIANRIRSVLVPATSKAKADEDELRAEAFDEASTLAVPVYPSDDGRVFTGIERYRMQLVLMAAKIRSSKAKEG